MSEDKDLKQNYELLDKILEILVSQETYSIETVNLINTAYSLHLKPKGKESYVTFEEFFENIDFSNVETNKKLKIKFALLYLITKELVIFQNSITTITYQGIIKHSESFVTIYEKETSERNRLLNVENFQSKISVQMLAVNAVIAFGTFVAAIYYIHQFFLNIFCS